MSCQICKSWKRILAFFFRFWKRFWSLRKTIELLHNMNALVSFRSIGYLRFLISLSIVIFFHVLTRKWCLSLPVIQSSIHSNTTIHSNWSWCCKRLQSTSHLWLVQFKWTKQEISVAFSSRCFKYDLTNGGIGRHYDWNAQKLYESYGSWEDGNERKIATVGR